LSVDIGTKTSEKKFPLVGEKGFWLNRQIPPFFQRTKGGGSSSKMKKNEKAQVKYGS